MNTRIAVVVLATWLVAACGGGSDATGPAGDGGAANAPPSPAASGGGPDLGLARERLLLNANLITPDSVRLVSFMETGRAVDGPSVVVSYEAEVEFVADTYFHADHKAGDHAKMFGEAEYFNEAGNWTLRQMGIYPR
jgi:hypothetical protein